MKRIISLLLILAVVFLFASCGNKSGTEETAENAAVNETSPEEQSDAGNTQAVNVEGKKILTVYFSSANTADADAVSSATPSFRGMGSTEYLAVYINSKVGGDIAKITLAKDYPESYNGTLDAAKSERDNDERPEFKPLDVNPGDYDVIFIGYPMWWYTLPMIMYTFFDKYDLSGKTIIPFNTHEGSGDGGTYNEIRDFEPDATVLEGLPVRGGNAGKADSDIDNWLSGLGF